MGRLQDHPWSEVLSLVPWVLGSLLVALAYARSLNVMLLGEETAQHLGVSPERVRRILLGAATVATAAAVSVSGIIGFVGFIIPHLIRLIWGPDHRTLLPASMLAGAGFLVLADAVARTAFAPEEIPVGIVTAIAGAPFFLALLRSRSEPR
jgi:iron complex transport system permease protein